MSRARAVVQPSNSPDDPMFREFFGRHFDPQAPSSVRRVRQGSARASSSRRRLHPDQQPRRRRRRPRSGRAHRPPDVRRQGRWHRPGERPRGAEDRRAGPRTLPLGDSERRQVGDVVLAIGNPLGVGQTVTMGIISAKGRSTGVGDGSYEDFLQTDARDQPGQLGRRARQPRRASSSASTRRS